MPEVGRPSTEVYRQSIEKLPRAVGRARRKAAVQVALCTAAVMALARALPGATADAEDRELIVGMLAVLASPYFLWRAGRRVRRYWNALELSIGAEAFRISAKGAGRVSIRRDEVLQITEDIDGLEVRSASGEVAQIPTTVEGYVDARARLGAWHPLRWRVSDLRSVAWLVGGAGLLAAVFLLTPRATAFAGSGVLVHLALSFDAAAEIRANPRLPAARKALSTVLALGSTVALLVVVVVASMR
jgi:hypothetical protein